MSHRIAVLLLLSGCFPPADETELEGADPADAAVVDTGMPGLGPIRLDAGAGGRDTGTAPAPDTGTAPAPDAGPVDEGPLVLDVQTTPNSPVAGSAARIRLSLSRENGGPVTGARIVATLWMVTHGHGGASPTITETGGGVYESTNLTFSMAGPWDVTFRVTVGGETLEFVKRVNVSW